MQRLGRAFDVKETRVKAAEPFPTPMLGALPTHRNQLRRTTTSSVDFTAHLSSSPCESFGIQDHHDAHHSTGTSAPLGMHRGSPGRARA